MAPLYSAALITGAANGLGRALALELAREKTAIAALDINEQALRSLEADIAALGARCAAVVADVTDAAAVQTAVAQCEERLGPIDLAIANAGIGIETSGLNLRADEMARVIGVNLIGVSNTLAAVLPGMLKRRQGHLAAISSVASFRGLPRMLGYCASKSGVNAIMDGLRVEVQPFGIHVTTICPGWIRTAMTASIKVPMGEITEVEDAARHIVGALRKRRAFAAFPRRMVWRLRFLNWLPRSWADGWLRKLLKGL